MRVGCFVLDDAIDDGGQVMLLGLTGWERSGFGTPDPSMLLGEDGGDGVDSVDRNVGPGSGVRGDIMASDGSRSTFSNGFENDFAGHRLGSGCAKGVDNFDSTTAIDDSGAWDND